MRKKHCERTVNGLVVPELHVIVSSVAGNKMKASVIYAKIGTNELFEFMSGGPANTAREGLQMLLGFSADALGNRVTINTLPYGDGPNGAGGHPSPPDTPAPYQEGHPDHPILWSSDYTTNPEFQHIYAEMQARTGPGWNLNDRNCPMQ